MPFFWTGQENRNANWLVTCSKIHIHIFFCWIFHILGKMKTSIFCHMNSNLLALFGSIWNDLRSSHWIDDPLGPTRLIHPKTPVPKRRPACRAAPAAPPELGPCGSARRNATATVAGLRPAVHQQSDGCLPGSHKNCYITHDDPIN